MQQHSTFICNPHVRGCECGSHPIGVMRGPLDIGEASLL
ncbi:hypothetical protein LCGC14_1658340 [marine sediment metagenome]|uniref:Uncharacterized protein n=1 Tax=marine sediment metagenome TaxID=412755 RepID=A0A0F9HVJ4_9ZZZZ